jgi:hypothetical protein
MIYDMSIIVTAEANHPIIWEFYQNNQPYLVNGRAYQMVIRENEDGTPTPGVDVTFVCVADANRAECTGDCTTLIPGTKYSFQVVEDGIAIISGKCDVVARLV